MTISSTTRKAGPYSGNGVTTVFPFSFKVFDKTDVQALKVDSNGISTPLILDSDYSVLLNTDQTNSPGGQITYPISGTPLAAGYQLVMLGDLPYDQETDLTNQGGFYPQVIEDMVDRATIQIQQLAEILSRALVVTEVETNPPTLPPTSVRAGQILGFDSSGNVIMYGPTTSVGAGDLRDEIFVAGVDFTPGVTTALTLSRQYTSRANLWVDFDDASQHDFAFSGTTLSFPAPIPAGITNVFVKGGTTLSLNTPGYASVGDDALSWGTSLRRNFTSIAALRANKDPRFQSFFVTGYYKSLDGGGGPYEVDPLDTSSADNGGSIIVDGLGRRCKLNTGPDWYVEQFGGGGIGGGADDAVYINAAIAALPDHGGTVRLRGKQYNIGSTISIGNGDAGSNPSTKNGVRLIGVGGGAGAYANPTLLQAIDNGGTVPYIDSMISIKGAIDSVQLEGFKIYCLGAHGSMVNTAIFMHSATGCTFRNIHMEQYALTGLWVMAGVAPTGNYNISNEFHQVSGISSVNGHIGLLMDGVYSVSNDTWLSSFYNCRFDTYTAINAIAGYFKFVDSCSFHRCHFVGNNTAGVGLSGCTGAYFNAVGNNGFPCGLNFHFCSILSTFVNESVSDKIRPITFEGYGTLDNEAIPTHSMLRGYTDTGVRFNGWGA